MARGWESKSVELHREDGEASREAREQRPREEIERERKRESLESSRRGVLRELETSRSSLHKAALEQALKHLDEQLSKLGYL
jgi:hypothetical protein